MSRDPIRRASRLLVMAGVIAAGAVVAQDRSSQELRREGWQKVPEIFEAMALRPGSVVADVGAGDGFFTTRLATAVSPSGRVYAVDISDQQLDRLRRRLADDGVSNVTVVKGAPDDPRLPEGALDAVLVVNAYHEMEAHEAMLAGMRQALKPDGRLVIVEPISDRRRGRSRAEQARAHEIAPEHVLAETRLAGFRVLGLQDPFTKRPDDVEWLIVLQRDDVVLGTPPPDEETAPSPGPAELDDPSLRVTVAELKQLLDTSGVTVLDVRDAGSYARAHIPGALSTPLQTVGDEHERLRRLARPIVTYCS